MKTMTQTNCDKCKEDSPDLKQCPVCGQSLCSICWGDKLQLFCSHCCEEIKTKEIPFKICAKCKIEQPIGEFCKNKNEKDELNRICKSCEREYHKDYTQTKQGKKTIQKALKKYFKTDKGKEIVKKCQKRQKEWLKTEEGNKYLREYYQKHKEQIKKNQIKYYQIHKEEIHQNHRKYYQKHKESIIAYQKKYREENREKINASRRKHYKEKKEEK